MKPQVALVLVDQIRGHSLEPFCITSFKIRACRSLRDSIFVGLEIDVDGRADAVDVSGDATGFQDRIERGTQFFGNGVRLCDGLSRGDLFEQGDTCCGRQRRCVEGPEVDDSLEPIVVRVAGLVEQGHHVRPAHDRSARHSTGQDLRETGKVGQDVEELLCSARTVAKAGDDFVENEENIPARGEISKLT